MITILIFHNVMQYINSQKYYDHNSYDLIQNTKNDQASICDPEEGGVDVPAQGKTSKT